MKDNQVEAQKKPWVKSEDVFKLILFLIVAMWVICLKYFIEFRTMLGKENIVYFEFKYSWYILVSFAFMTVTGFISRYLNTFTIILLGII